MTRTAPRAVWRGFTWRGEPGDLAPFSVVLPPELRERYLVTGRLRVLADSPPLVRIASVTVVDRGTGARVRMRGNRTAMAPGDAATPEYVGRLWADARLILGLAHRQLGRPTGTGVIRDDEEILKVIAEVRAAEIRPTLVSVAAYSGTFTYDNLRSYLRRTGRKWRDLSRT